VASILISAEAISTFESLFQTGEVYELFDEFAPYQQEVNASVTSADVVKAYRIRRALQEEMARFFTRYDVVVTPNFLSVAPRVSDDLSKALGAYTDPVGAVGNSCGLPSIALPCGFGKGHMPIGFQVMGPPWEESTLLAIGELYQKRTSFHLAHPPLA
jgi:aspartyl-tRNA(Asn)/glutamyl-tRNA(Gln) amidotransferase subunit A